MCVCVRVTWPRPSLHLAREYENVTIIKQDWQGGSCCRARWQTLAMGPEVICSAARMQPGTRIKCKGMVFQGGRWCVGGSVRVGGQGVACAYVSAWVCVWCAEGGSRSEQTHKPQRSTGPPLLYGVWCPSHTHHCWSMQIHTSCMTSHMAFFEHFTLKCCAVYQHRSMKSFSCAGSNVSPSKCAAESRHATIPVSSVGINTRAMF